MYSASTLPVNPVTSRNGFLDGWKLTEKIVKHDGYLRLKGVYLGIAECRRYIFVLTIARLKEIMINVCFVGEFGW